MSLPSDDAANENVGREVTRTKESQNWISYNRCMSGLAVQKQQTTLLDELTVGRRCKGEKKLES